MLPLVLFLLVTTGTDAFFTFYHEGESASLNCSAGRGEVQFWFLHGKGGAIDANNTEGDVSLNDDGTLQFQNVSKEAHEGVHICVIKYQHTLEAYSVEMEVEPLPPRNLWEHQYKRMFITAVVASLTCLLLFIGFCIVKTNRWKVPLTLVPSAENGKRKASYINPAIEEDDYNCRM